MKSRLRQDGTPAPAPELLLAGVVGKMAVPSLLAEPTRQMARFSTTRTMDVCAGDRAAAPRLSTRSHASCNAPQQVALNAAARAWAPHATAHMRRV